LLGGTTPALSFVANATSPIAYIFCNTIQWDQSAGGAGGAGTILIQNPRFSDLPVNDMSFIPQAPWASATDANRDAPNVTFDIPSPAPSGTHGKFEVVISAANRFVVATTQLEVGVPSLRWEDLGVGYTIEQIASATDGSVCRIRAQEGSGGDGGDLELIGGIMNNATRGGVALVVGGDVSDPGGIYMVEVQHISSQFVTAIGAIAGISVVDFPADIADPAIYVGNAPPSTIGAGYPVNGFSMFSDDGRPSFKTATGGGAVGERWFTLDGEMTVAGGAFDRYFVIYIDGTRYKIPVHLDS
jgi:hypothetical protein